MLNRSRESTNSWGTHNAGVKCFTSHSWSTLTGNSLEERRQTRRAPWPSTTSLSCSRKIPSMTDGIKREIKWSKNGYTIQVSMRLKSILLMNFELYIWDGMIQDSLLKLYFGHVNLIWKKYINKTIFTVYKL